MSKIIQRVTEQFPDDVVGTHQDHGDDTVIMRPDRMVEVARFLRDDPFLSFEMLMDLTGVDYLGQREPRFEVVYHFYSLSKNHRLRIRVGAEDEAPKVPSVVSVFKSALWMEREAWDLYGIDFEGHPDLRRILMYPEFKGHPLRKDYEMEHRQPRIPPRPGRRHL